MYPEELVAPMRQELTAVGFKELKNTGDVKNILQQKGVALIVVNSVCGCAAGTARPGVVLSLRNAKVPAHLATVFAGVDLEATQAARAEMIPFPPSSPSIAVFNDGELVHMLERHHIEGRSAEMIAENLIGAFDEYC